MPDRTAADTGLRASSSTMSARQGRATLGYCRPTRQPMHSCGDFVPFWIDNPADLRARLENPPAWVGLDTEFVRERTYWPQLALVQMAIGDDILLIDPLVSGMDEA